MSYIKLLTNTLNGVRCGTLSHLRKSVCDAPFIAHRGYCSNLTSARSCILLKQPVSDPFTHEYFASGFSAIYLTHRRNFNKKKTLKIPPTKELKFDYSGDLVTSLDALKLEEPRPGYEDVKILTETEDERLKRMFSLEFADGQTLLKKRLDDIMKETQEHEADLRSSEVKIATETIRIRNLMKHCLAFRKDKKHKANLVKRIWKRYKLLRLLQQRDIEKFNWLCDKLQIKFTLVPEYNRKESKRSKRKREAREAFFRAREGKLENFRNKLEVEKVAFEEHKKRELADIEAHLKTFGVDKMESVDQVVADLGLGEPYLKKKEKKKSRRQQLLEMKFALYPTLPKYQPKF